MCFCIWAKVDGLSLEEFTDSMINYSGLTLHNGHFGRKMNCRPKFAPVVERYTNKSCLPAIHYIDMAQLFQLCLCSRITICSMIQRCAHSFQLGRDETGFRYHTTIYRPYKQIGSVCVIRRNNTEVHNNRGLPTQNTPKTDILCLILNSYAIISHKNSSRDLFVYLTAFFQVALYLLYTLLRYLILALKFYCLQIYTLTYYKTLEKTA